MSEVQANDAIILSRSGCDAFHVEALTGEVLHSRQNDRSELLGMLLDVCTDIFGIE
jgi:hypothetical protein